MEGDLHCKDLLKAVRMTRKGRRNDRHPGKMERSSHVRRPESLQRWVLKLQVRLKGWYRNHITGQKFAFPSIQGELEVHSIKGERRVELVSARLSLIPFRFIQIYAGSMVI